MKIWRGNEYNERGRQQLTDYLNYFHQNKGYLLSFNFNRKKETGIKTLTLGNKTIIEASKSIDYISSVTVLEQKAKIDGNKIAEYYSTIDLSFSIDETRDNRKENS